MRKVKFTEDYEDNSKGDVKRVRQNRAFTLVDEKSVAEYVTPEDLVKDTELGETKAMEGSPSDTAASDTTETQQKDATPAATELAEEEGVTVSDIDGSGTNGKVIKSDVESYLEE